MPRVLVADMQSVGHHARYVRWVLEADFPGDVELVVAGPKSLLDHDELTHLRRRFVAEEVVIDDAAASLQDATSFLRLLRRQLAYRSLYARAVRQAKSAGTIDFVFVPYVDLVLDAWAALGTGFEGTLWSGITMQPVFHLGKIPTMVAQSRRDDSVRERMYRRLLRNSELTKLLTIDPVMLEYAKSHFDAQEQGKLQYLPDPSIKHDLPNRDSSRALLGISDSARVVLLYGALHPRKGIRQLLSAAAAPQCPATIHVLLAGRHSQEVRELLQSSEAIALANQGRLHVIDDYLDDDKEKLVLSAADYMWVGYSGFYRMSGVLVLATQHQIPSIFTKEGIIGYLGRKYNLGPELDPASTETAIEALTRLAVSPKQYAPSVAAAAHTFDAHSIKQFQSLIVQTVAGQLKSQRQAVFA